MYTRNNLDRSGSPYLRQHAHNPIHWQEWSREVIAYARQTGRIVFVSVGYSTCHWCHVMAAEAFSDAEVAGYLNRHFVCIKVDREQRPDIDHYLMAYLQETRGRGGWPLNVFLTADLRPFFAITYVPVRSGPDQSGPGRPLFLDLLEQVVDHHRRHAGDIPAFVPAAGPERPSQEEAVVASLKRILPAQAGPQFPPHNSLLFLLSYYEDSRDPEVATILHAILDRIARSGLHDHLQGGFFRYCVDESWSLPHFEKMLYDQAMLLWVYSLAFKLFHRPQYRTVVEKIRQCLEETYQCGNLYYCAHDADTNHREGQTYLWHIHELQAALTAEEYDRFSGLYAVNENCEGAIHLVKKQAAFLPQIEHKLLQVRKSRPQPFTDRKIVTSWNALLGIALLTAFRALGQPVYLAKATALCDELRARHHRDGILHHSSLDDQAQKDALLEDQAALLLLATYLHEETGGHRDLLCQLRDGLEAFFHDHWVENHSTDFVEVAAATFDHPTPSSAALADMARLRTAIVLGETYGPVDFKEAYSQDFHNLMTLVANGHWHIIHTPRKIDWNDLPLNCIQVQSDSLQDCHRGACREYASVAALLQELQAPSA